MRHEWIQWTVIGIVAGAWMRPFTVYGNGTYLACIAAAVVALIYAARTKSVYALAGATMIAGMVIGALRVDAMPPVTHPALDALVGGTMTVTGVVVRPPDERETSMRAVVQVPVGERGSDTGRILLVLPPSMRLFLNDQVTVTGKLEMPESFETDTGRLFPYEEWLAAQGIGYVMHQPFVREVVDASPRIHPWETLVALKDRLVESLTHTLPAPHSALAAGELLGAREGLGESLTDAFRITGVIHVVVLSGYNLTIVAEWIMRLLAMGSLRMRTLAGIGTIGAFALMTGASATVVRAAIMASIALLSRTFNRPSAGLRALAIAAAGMVLWNPRIAAFDPSFQLSFAATLGLILLAPLIEARLERVTDRFGIRSIVAATLATQLAVLPLLVYLSGAVSLVALPANLLILPAVPLSMGVSFSAAIAGLISPTIATFAGAAAYALLEYQLLVVDLWSTVPFAQMGVGLVSGWVVIGMYGLILGVYVTMRRTYRV